MEFQNSGDKKKIPKVSKNKHNQKIVSEEHQTAQ